MDIAVLFDGAGLARLGLEQAGHDCTGFELDPLKHHLSTFVGSGNCALADATAVDLSSFGGIWASPPCQWLSSARTQGNPLSNYAGDFLQWALDLAHLYPDKVVWIENVLPQGRVPSWGKTYNAAQFQPRPIQNRTRLVGGSYKHPHTYRAFSRSYDWLTICPAITATEYKGCGSDKRRASRFYGRRLTLEECAHHQGFTIPQEWYKVPDWYTPPKGKGKRETQWRNNLYEAIGNGVPTYMSRAFGQVYSDQPADIPEQIELFSA